MTDEDILAIHGCEFPRGTVTVHEIWDGQVLFASKLKGAADWNLVRLGRRKFIEAFEREQK